MKKRPKKQKEEKPKTEGVKCEITPKQVIAHFMLFSFSWIFERITSCTRQTTHVRPTVQFTMEYEFISGKRRDSNLLYTIGEQQLYRKKSMYKNKEFYNCYIKKCKSRIFITDGVVCQKCPDFMEHNHGVQKALYEELKVLNNIKRKCAETRGTGDVNALSGIRESFKAVCSR